MFTATEDKIIKQIVDEWHVFRKLDEIINFEELFTPLQKLYSTTGTEGIDVINGEEKLNNANVKNFWQRCSLGS